MAGRITLTLARTGQVIRGMLRTQAPSRSRLVIGRTIRAVRGITWAAATTSGARDIGHGATAEESGFTVITFGDKRIQPRVVLVGHRRHSHIGGSLKRWGEPAPNAPSGNARQLRDNRIHNERFCGN